MNNLICITPAHVIASIDQFDLVLLQVYLRTSFTLFKQYFVQ